MNVKSKGKNGLVLIIEIIITLALCVGMAASSFTGLSAESKNFTSEIMADYSTLSRNYVRAFKILRMEAVTQINKDLTFDEMQTWLLSKDEEFADAIGDDIYDGFAYTYKGGYAHSWNYGDYSNYDATSRPWYQTAAAANGEVAVVAPYTTYLSGTDLIERYDTLRMSVAQRYNDEISFDFDLDVKEINALIADRQTIYENTIAFLYDANGFILSSTSSDYYGHNINTADSVLSEKMCAALNGAAATNSDKLSLKVIDGEMRLVYSLNEGDMTTSLLVPFKEFFVRNLLSVLFLALILIGVEVLFYKNTEHHLELLERGKESLNEALSQAESASHAKGDFMSRMSHEIRTPLNAIIGYLEIAKDDKDDLAKVENCIDKSQLASRHLLSIINDVLDISSIESGRMKLAHDDFDMKQMVNELTTLFYSQAKSKNVDFVVRITSLKNEWLVGDEMRVKQILLNLLSNAVKFTPAGGTITLSINQILQGASDKTHIEFKVADTGIGMSKEFMDRMFKPFEQESAATAHNYGGTGLGLSISNNLTHIMGGQLDVDSEQGKGTTFTVLLPFDIAENQMQQTTDSFSNVSALVVDDEEDSCIYIQKMLAHFGVTCDTVTSGKKALRRVESRLESNHPYDICIIDWNMHGMDGLETSRKVRELCGEGMPIIIATAYDYNAIIDAAKEAGVNKIVSKPLFQSTLFNLLVNTYGKYQPAAADKKDNVDFKGLKVLLAEDNEMNMEIAVDILSKAGLVVTQAVNGQDVLDKFVNSTNGTFDAILMDVQMPVMDGYAATRKIRESAHPQARTIPIIAMTANAFTEDVTAALAAGMNDHVSKPINYSKLFTSLNRLINKPQ